MRFPRNNKVFRGQLDAAPYAGVFFLLIIFLLVNSSFVFTPGVPIQLPDAPDLPGTDRPTIAVAVDESSRFYFNNQVTPEATLRDRLREASSKTPDLALIIHADRKARYETLVRLSLLAREAGIKNAIMATRPVATPVPQSPPGQ
ncbi:MAG: biopolymer transporter ExbD [Verrucomicrobia subdivision 3 bacterium]|nr:biopolymer transporter ExbD [Limisphaerales bacterium]